MTLRQDRVKSQMIHEISEMIHREVRDPRLGFVTVTDAEIGRDLRNARVYVSVLGDESVRAHSLRILNGASGMLRGEFARRAHLRVAPELTFLYDEGIERGQHIFELLKSVEKDLLPAEGAEEASDEAHP
jgi:ribosome-binding factor A